MVEHPAPPGHARTAGREPSYRLAGKGREDIEDARLGLLEQLFDPGSCRRRDLVKPGWRCLEVGAGRGSMAIWLAERVGSDGHVVATDIDTFYLDRLDVANLEVHRHNILADPLDVLGAGSFDLVCSRLVLFWLAGKQQSALQRMVECLRPGGWLVDEDGDWGSVVPVDPEHREYASYHAAFRGGEWWAARGYDPVFGRKPPALFERCGLENIHHEVTAQVVRGGSAWSRWWQQSLEGIRASERAAGSSTEALEAEYQALIAPLSDPSFWLHSVLLHGCRGQRPQA